MISKPTQTKLALYFCAMIVLHGDVLWHARRSIPQGLPDFSIFYTAGRILRDRQGSRLYDDALQESVQRSFSPLAVQRRGVILPYNHPPFEALLFVPLAHLPYVTAYLTWFLVNAGLLCSIPFLLRRRLTTLGNAPLYLWLLASLAFFPIFIALIQGQDSILLLFLYCLTYASVGRRSEFSVGGWLALGLYKYHLVAPFVLPLWRRKRLIAAFLSVAVSLGLISLAITGWQGLLGYPRYVWGERARCEVCLEFAPETHREPARADFSYRPRSAPRDPDLLNRIVLGDRVAADVVHGGQDFVGRLRAPPGNARSEFGGHNSD